MIKRPDLVKYNQTHSKKGADNPNWKGGLPHCKDCNKQLSSYKKKHIRCKSCENKRRYKNPKNHPMYGKTSSYKRFLYNNTWMKSSWEYIFAYWLDLSHIKWQYELNRFKLNNTTYTPDFYLPEFNLYIEIKGWQRRNKYLKFRKQYPELDIKLFDRKKLHNYLGLSYRELNKLPTLIEDK